MMCDVLKKNHTLTIAVKVRFSPMMIRISKGNSKNYKFNSKKNNGIN